jgi:hypothetical protein
MLGARGEGEGWVREANPYVVDQARQVGGKWRASVARESASRVVERKRVGAR